MSFGYDPRVQYPVQGSQSVEPNAETVPEMPAVGAIQYDDAGDQPPQYRPMTTKDGVPAWPAPQHPDHMPFRERAWRFGLYAVTTFGAFATAATGIVLVASRSSADIVQPANSHPTTLVPPSASYAASPTATVKVAPTPTPKPKPKPPTPSQPPKTATPTPNAAPAPHWVNVKTPDGLVGEYAVCTTGSTDEFKDGSQAPTSDVIDNSGVKLPDC